MSSESELLGPVRLRLRDRAAAERFYAGLLRLETRPLDGDALALAAPGGAPVLELEFDPAAPPRAPRAPGLFHLAILLPRTGLAAVTRHLIASRYPLQGLSDHGVSEALYLADPEGTGIEIYADRPRAEWPASGGRVAMYTRPLDLDDLLAAAPADAWDGFEPVTRLGHVHLQVSDLAAAERFYHGALGFDVTVREYPGALFFSRGGYHHHVGANIWQSRGAPTPPEGVTGLVALRFRLGDAADAALRRLREQGVEVEEIPGGWTTRDPSGSSVELIPH